MVMQIIPEVINLTQVRQAGRRLFQRKPIRKVVKEITDTANILWNKGWAERNAGNMSVNVTSLVPGTELQKLPSFPFLPMQKPFPVLERNVFLVTTTGSRMRDLAENPEENLCFIYISENGSAYHIVAAGEEISDIKPTSELITHLSIHQMLVQKKRPETALLHAHVTELIALTHLPEMKSEETLNNLFFSMHPETKMFVPDGAGFIPFAIPGSDKLAQATARSFETHQAVVWENHGCMAAGRGIADAFDTIDLLAKAAGIWFMVEGVRR